MWHPQCDIGKYSKDSESLGTDRENSDHKNLFQPKMSTIDDFLHGPSLFIRLNEGRNLECHYNNDD